MFIVADPEQLNFWLRRFAPRVVLRLGSEFGEVFAPSAGAGDRAEVFVQAVLKRLPPSRGFIRPVVVVEGLASVNGGMDGHAREVVTRALANWGAAAAVIIS